MERYGKDPRVVKRTSEAVWRKPFKWQKEAERLNTKIMVFTCSWSDFFHEDADEWRQDAWNVMAQTPNLVYQVLTKRADRISGCLPYGFEASEPPDWGQGYPNVWLGVSVENKDALWRINHLTGLAAKARFLSCEPLLGPLGLTPQHLASIDWVIVGGESGPDHREMDHAWAREVRDVCDACNIPFFFKQSSGLLPGRGDRLDGVEHKRFPLALAQ